MLDKSIFKQRYEKYMRSPAWRDRRRQRLKVADNCCEWSGGIEGNGMCDETKGLEVHHVHYNTLGAERDEDLEVLCRFHHLVRHVEDAVPWPRVERK